MPRYKRPRYIHVYRDKHGKQRIYYNRPGSKKIPLPGPIYSEAFMVAYQKVSIPDVFSPEVPNENSPV